MERILLFLEFLVEGLLMLFETKRPEIGHGAQWGERRNNPKATGGWKFGRRNISLEESFRGAMVLGGSGSGKTVGSIIPSILQSCGSLVIHDPSCELILKTGPALYEKGYEILVFNPSAINLSSGFNPIEKQLSAEERNVLAKRIVTLLYSKSGDDTFWNTSAEALLSMCIEIVQSLPAEFHNLPNLYHLLNQLESKTRFVSRLVERIDSPLLSGNFTSFLNTEEKVRSGVLSTARSSLSYLNDMNVGRLLGKNSITASRLRKKKTAVFIQTGTAKQEYFYLITSLLFEELFAQLLQEAPKQELLPIHFILDEAASLSCPSLSTAMANLRKYNVGILLSLQDYSQLVERYGEHEAQTIRSNAYTQVIMPGVGLSTGTYYERLLGRTSKENGSDILITADRIRRLRQGSSLFIQGNKEARIIETNRIKRKEKSNPRIHRDPSLVLPSITLFNYSSLQHESN